MTVPWREEAAVIRVAGPGGEREQVYYGQLWQMVEWVRVHPDRDRLTIWLPERRVKPVCFEAAEIHALLLMADWPSRSFGFG